MFTKTINSVDLPIYLQNRFSLKPQKNKKKAD